MAFTTTAVTSENTAFLTVGSDLDTGPVTIRVFEDPSPQTGLRGKLIKETRFTSAQWTTLAGLTMTTPPART